MAEWLVAHKADVVLVKESLRGKGPVYVFSDAGVEMRQVGAETLAEALTAERRGGLGGDIDRDGARMGATPS